MPSSWRITPCPGTPAARCSWGLAAYPWRRSRALRLQAAGPSHPFKRKWLYGISSAGEGQHELGSTLGFGKGNVPAVCTHDLVADREPQAGALIWRARGEKGIENRFAVL